VSLDIWLSPNMCVNRSSSPQTTNTLHEIENAQAKTM